MKQFPNHKDDLKLIEFLQQYSPVAPSPENNFEDNLFNLLAKEPQIHSQIHSRKWLLPSAIAASLILISGGYYFLKPSPQMANQNEEIEEFLVNSWDGTIQGNYINNENTPEGEWLILTNFENNQR